MIDQKLLDVEFEYLKNELYFNSAAAGPSPARSRKSLEYAFERELKPSLHEYEEWSQIPDQLRVQISNFSGFPEDQISHHASVGEIFSLVAQGYPLNEGDIVVGFESEYPSDVLPWMLAADSKKFQFKLLSSNSRYDLSQLKSELPINTKLLNLSHVSFCTGDRADLVEIGKLCRERGILFVVDFSQSLGAFQISAEEREFVDVGACVTYKWLLGCYGHAFGYFSEMASCKIERRLANWLVSSMSKNSGSLTTYTLNTLPGARKFDRGQTANPLVMRCLSSSLDLLTEIGAEAIERKNLELRKFFTDQIDKKKYEIRSQTGLSSSISVITPRNIDALEVFQKLRREGVKLSLREGGLRFSFHLFNSISQIEKVLSFL